MNAVSHDSLKLPASYWIISSLALVWMLFGVAAWFMDLMMPVSALEQMDAAQRQLYTTRPQWLFVVYGIAIFAGLAGAIALLMRRKWARTAFLVSLVAVILQFGYTFVVMDAIQVVGPARALPLPIVIVVVGALLLWYSTKVQRRGWLR